MTSAPGPRAGKGDEVFLALLCALAFAALTACRRSPAPGGPCRIPNLLACTGSDRAVIGDARVWVEVPCGGQRGCTRQGGSDTSDDTIAADGDR